MKVGDTVQVVCPGPHRGVVGTIIHDLPEDPYRFMIDEGGLCFAEDELELVE